MKSSTKFCSGENKNFQSQNNFLMSSTDEQVMAVVLPVGSEPGQKLNIQLDDGRVFEIITPEGTSPGQTINVVVPNNVSGEVVESVDATSAAPKEYSNNSKTIGVAAGAAIVGTLVLGPGNSRKNTEI